MTITPTALLSLPIITTGTESGTWGDVVDNGLTAYLDIAIAGGLNIAITTTDVTLANTAGTSAATNIGSTTAQYAILNISGAKTAARNLNLPISSKQYTINNSAATGGFLLTVRGVTPTTGVTLVDGEKCIVAWSGTDYVKIASSVGSNIMGFTTTATAGATTILTNTSSFYQLFTGVLTQTVRLPVTSTLALGWTFHICNNSTGNLSVQSSGSDPLITVLPGTTAMCTCILITGTTATSWEAGLTDFSTATGTGAVVLDTSPTLTTSLTTGSTSFNLLNTTATTLNIGGGATAVNIGAATGTLTVANTTLAAKAITASTTLGVTGVSTLTGGAVVQGLTVGYGPGAISSNTVFGQGALLANSSGSQNTAIGFATLISNTSGGGNTVLGYSAMTTNTTGISNVAIGSNTLAANNSDYNVAIGSPAMNSNTSGVDNTAVGYAALNSNTTGYYNTVVGSGSGQLTYGIQNSFFGYNSGKFVSTGNNNTILGAYTGLSAPISETGSNWIVLSDGAGTVRQAMDATSVQFLTGAVVVYAPAPATTISAVTTLTNAQILPQIVVTSGTSFTLTMPTGTTLDTLITWAGDDLGFDFSVINTASGTITMAVNTGVTSVGTLTVLTGISARFRICRTAASAYIVYRIS